jgi:hypothetical protein
MGTGGNEVRIRTIKPDFWTDAKIATLSYLARLLFIGLWNVADDEGRFKSDPRILKGCLFPTDDETTVEKITGALRELSGSGRVVLAEIDGEQYGCCPNFRKHQKINKPSKSRLPEFTEPSGSLPVALREGYVTEEEEEKEVEVEKEVVVEKRRRGEKITWDATAQDFAGITQCDMDSWTEAYQHVSLEHEMSKAKEWVIANPAKAKTNWRRFLTNWFSRSEDRAPKNYVPPPAAHRWTQEELEWLEAQDDDDSRAANTGDSDRTGDKVDGGVVEAGGSYMPEFLKGVGDAHGTPGRGG